MHKIVKNTKELFMSPAVIVIMIILAFLVYKKMSLISEKDVMELVKNEFVVIDVRTPKEFSSRHALDAINIPLGDITQQLTELPTDKETTIFLYCLSGGRSGTAVSILEKAGYTNVHNLGSVSRACVIIERVSKQNS